MLPLCAPIIAGAFEDVNAESALRSRPRYGILCVKSGVYPLVEVSAAVIARGGKVLICRRSGGRCAGLWEFPGGKREPGETSADCLARECAEELGVTLSVGEPLLTLPWAATGMRFTFFAAELLAGEPECRVHDRIVWENPDAFPFYAFCPADTAAIPLLFARG